MKRPLKVMVIDDSKTIRRTARTLLEAVGCDVLTAVDGYEALGRIVDQVPDLIFVDVLMPRLDGYQTCAVIKHNSTFKDTPVVLLSSRDGVLDKARGRSVGADAFVTKPFSTETLLAAIHAQVPGFAGQRQRETP